MPSFSMTVCVSMYLGQVLMVSIVCDMSLIILSSPDPFGIFFQPMTDVLNFCNPHAYGFPGTTA